MARFNRAELRRFGAATVLVVILLAQVTLAAPLREKSKHAPGGISIMTRAMANQRALKELAIPLALLNATGKFQPGRRLLQPPKKSPSAQLQYDGILQEAVLDASCATSPTCGGHLTVNGERVTVPKNIIVMFPSQQYTWQELFDSTGKTGLALGESPFTYTVSVAANLVGTEAIAGLIDLSQSPILGGAGYIDAIDYAIGQLTVSQGDSGGPGVKIRLNDPTGRYGKLQPGMDPRFAVDPDNPTVHSATGFPMCIPRSDPAAADDPLCPKANRPADANGFLTIIRMNSPGNNPDPMKMVPFAVGDYITFAGVLDTAGFVAAYEVVNNVAVYTQPGIDPAFTVFETALIGTGGLNVLGAGEAAIRSRFGGFTTDWTRPVQLWALDFDPTTGVFTKRDYGQVMPDPGAAGGVGAVEGRWRFRPPCTNKGPLAVGSPYLGNKGCTPPPAGVYTPPSREVMSEVVGCTPVKGAVNNITSGDAVAGCAGCMYRNPTIESIWPENIPGTPIVENNFGAVPFLVKGGYKASSGVLVGTLNPWPSDKLPTASCLAPTITNGGPYSVTNGGAVTVEATVTGPGAPFTFVWTCGAAGGSSAQDTALRATFSPVTGNTNCILTVTNTCGNKFTSTAAVTVVTAPKQVIQAIASQPVFSGTTNVDIVATLSSATDSAIFKWTPPAGITINKQVPALGTPSTSSTITIDAPVVPSSTVTSTNLVFTVTATDSAGAVSDPVSAIVIVRPSKDTVTITAVAFRCDKHRMTVTAGSSVVNPNLGLNLLPYTDNNGKVFGPSSLGTTLTNGGNGVYTITIEPVPMPSTTIASLSVQSDLGGVGSRRIVPGTDVKGTCTI